MTQIPFSTLGKYQIHAVLGEGGFATVYKARDTVLDVDVAMKVLDPLKSGDPDMVERFLQEAKVTARLNHPHIVALFETGQIENRYFIAFRYAPGQNLHTLLQERPLLPLDDVVSIIRQIAGALDYAHGQGVIHRDVKPSNIIVDDVGRATLTDFGIVKVLDNASIKTTTGAILSTPYYASPEQAESKPLDGRSDLYSLGVVAYQLLTGEVPHKADTTPSLYYKIVHETPAPPSTLNPRAAGPIEEVLFKALAKQPGERYTTGAAFAEALSDAVQHVKGERVESLYRQAEAYMSSDALDADDRTAGNLDEAETYLRQVLAIEPAHEAANELLAQLASHREWSEHYHTLADAFAQVQAQAKTVWTTYPQRPDPEGVLNVLIPAELRTSQRQESAKLSLPARLRLASTRQKIELALGVVAIVAALIVFLIAHRQGQSVDWTKYWLSQSLIHMIRLNVAQNFFRGIGIGSGGMGILLVALSCLKLRKS